MKACKRRIQGSGRTLGGLGRGGAGLPDLKGEDLPGTWIGGAESRYEHCFGLQTPLGPYLGPSWSHLGPMFAPSWRILAHLGDILAHLGPILA